MASSGLQQGFGNSYAQVSEILLQKPSMEPGTVHPAPARAKPGAFVLPLSRCVRVSGVRPRRAQGKRFSFSPSLTSVGRPAATGLLRSYDGAGYYVSEVAAWQFHFPSSFR